LGSRLAKNGIRIVNIDIVKEAIEDAAELYRGEGVGGLAEHIAGDAGAVLPTVLARGGASVVFLDPPRKGVDPSVISALLSSPPEKIIYLSCNPATLARDLALLKEAYRVEKITPYDMFPQTKHLEVLVILSRAGI